MDIILSKFPDLIARTVDCVFKCVEPDSCSFSRNSVDWPPVGTEPPYNWSAPWSTTPANWPLGRTPHTVGNARAVISINYLLSDRTSIGIGGLIRLFWLINMMIAQHGMACRIIACLWGKSTSGLRSQRASNVEIIIFSLLSARKHCLTNGRF